MTKRNPPSYTLVTLAAVMVTACSVEPTPSQTDRSAQPHQENQPLGGSTDIQNLTDIALADLAQRLAVDRQLLQVVDASSVTWSNGALGCPAPGGSYTQALVEGFHLVLTDGSAEYHYHASSAGKPFLCPEKRRRDPIVKRSQGL
ncbi:MAG TPA: hypothetical protein VKO38_05880 [Wenzhouxiangella sp.]|nr:hypothetical protein [Wenzhouxiangella sp.]